MTCSRHLSPENFHSHAGHADGLSDVCKHCMRWHKWKTRMNRRTEVHAIFGSRCCRCGNDDWRVLELDHINGGGTADRLQGRIDSAYSRAMIEYARAHKHLFQLLCANCHRIKTWEDRDRVRAAFPPVRPVSPEERLELRRASARKAARARASARTAEERSRIAKKGGETRKAAQTHCHNGHEFTPENTGEYRGRRICRTCKREGQAALRQKKKSA